MVPQPFSTRNCFRLTVVALSHSRRFTYLPSDQSLTDVRHSLTKVGFKKSSSDWNGTQQVLWPMSNVGGSWTSSYFRLWSRDCFGLKKISDSFIYWSSRSLLWGSSCPGTSSWYMCKCFLTVLLSWRSGLKGTLNLKKRGLKLKGIHIHSVPGRTLSWSHVN